MIKSLRKIFIIILVFVVLYFLCSIGFRAYVRKNTTINFLGDKYSKFDSLESNFIPFGADNCWYKTNIDYGNLLGLSFFKNDNNKNFVYCNDILGSTVYKKDSYKIPEFPSLDIVDELIMYCNQNDKAVCIKDKNHITTIVNYLSTFEASADTEKFTSIVFYAVSNKTGGLYQLNKRGSIYLKEDDKIGFGYFITGDLPDNIQDILQLYLRRQGDG